MAAISPDLAHTPVLTHLHGLKDRVARACERIAPSWPLDRFIAVNPFWSLTDQPLPEVASQLRAHAGGQLLMPRAWFQQAYAQGDLRDAHLSAAIAASDAPTTVDALRALLATPEPATSVRARVCDVADAVGGSLRTLAWGSFITNSVSQVCGGFFDEGQATFVPSRAAGLYACWRHHATGDRGPKLLMDFKAFRSLAAALPRTAAALIPAALEALEVAADQQVSYLWSLLLDQNGWASWCAYRRWTARLSGADDHMLIDLLAIRLAWEWLLLRDGGEAVAKRWRLAMAAWPTVDRQAGLARQDDWLLQAAMESAWRQPVIDQLCRGVDAKAPAQVSVQAVFCIDVRSEVIRRAIEATSPSAQTLGFAGFFGVPLEYQPHSTAQGRPQLPGLLAPRLRATDTGVSPAEAQQRGRLLDLGRSWRTFKSDAFSSFAFVEALGLGFAAKLAADGFGLSADGPGDASGLSAEAAGRRAPRLQGTVAGDALDTHARCDLAEGMLRGMSLTRDFAPLVLLAGHGSSTRNNPHAAGLDCGACCGQSGEVNARVAAALLNEAEVRVGLAARGIHITDATWFVAGLHHTTTDELSLFDLDAAPASHSQALNTLRGALRAAGDRARAERAERLGLPSTAPSKLRAAVQARSRDWAEVRPEWGLADNAAFIVSPRERCRHIDLGGRAFLHEYRHAEDDGYRVLEQIMTAPMVVTHWINFQYYASTVDNLRYGSGNKVLHNVVGAHLGVFEGNTGDLRIGLPMQSLHDGQRWMHTALRLSVFVEAPRAAIEGVLQRHAHVRALVENSWISLFQIDAPSGSVSAFARGEWHPQQAV